MPKPTFRPSRELLMSCSLKTLKLTCKDNGLPASGTKKDLVDRLLKAEGRDE